MSIVHSLTPATIRLRDELAGLDTETMKEKVRRERPKKRDIRLNSLKDRNTEIIRLYYEENKAKSEISDIMGLTVKSLDNVLWKERKKREGMARKKPGPKVGNGKRNIL